MYILNKIKHPNSTLVSGRPASIAVTIGCLRLHFRRWSWAVSCKNAPHNLGISRLKARGISQRSGVCPTVFATFSQRSSYIYLKVHVFRCSVDNGFYCGQTGMTWPVARPGFWQVSCIGIGYAANYCGVGILKR